MQSTIFFLQQELKQAKDTILSLESELNTVRTSNDNNDYATAATSLTNDYDTSVDDGCDNSSANSTTIVNGQTIKSENIDVTNINNENILSERTSLNNGIKHNNNSSVLNSERTTNKNYCNGEIDDGDDNNIDELNGEKVKGGVVTVGDDIKIQKSTTVTKIKCNEQINDNLSNNLSNYICKTNESTDTLKITISLPKRQRSNNYDSDSSEYSNNDNNVVDHTQQNIVANTTASTTVTGATTRTRSRKPIKKQRRTSFLTLDLQDEDTDMVAEMEENNPPVESIGSGKMLRSKSNGNVKKLRSKVDAD